MTTNRLSLIDGPRKLGAGEDMSSLDEAVKQLEGAIGRLEKVVGKSGGRARPDTVLAQTAAQVAARLDATIARLDRILED